MKIILGLGMLIVFICIFFIFHSFTQMVQGEVGCLFSEDIATDCDVVAVTYQFMINMSIIVVLSLVMLGVLYVVFSHVFRIESPQVYMLNLFKKGMRRVYRAISFS
ncbi:MAG: hypothetical protein V3V26_00730 [Candidatus Aenigmarchaeota archaeon]